MIPALSIDFETRSQIDLRKTSVYRYAEDPSTDVWCMAYAWGDEPVRLWIPGDPIPQVIHDAVNTKLPLRAWNAQFERVVWRLLLSRRYGFPVPKRDQWYCTQAEAYAQNLPAGLGRAAKVLGLRQQKDDKGHRLMLQMSKPRKVAKDGTVIWWDEPGKLKRLYAYCEQDVVVERAIAKRIRRLSHTERRAYLLDQLINDRGVQVDMDLVEAMNDLQAVEIREANAEIKRLTKGAVSTVNQVGKITDWIREQEGADAPDLKRNTIEEILENPAGFTDRSLLVLSLRKDTAKASVKKLAAIVRVVNSDGRARGLHQYHGASTGRWSGRLIQTQNLPRPEVSKPERFIEWVMTRDREAIAAEAKVMEVLSSLLRATLVASPGHRLISNDFSQIEARIVDWISGQDDMLEEWAKPDPKVYEIMGAFIYSKPVEEITKDSLERQVGKNTILGCGFGMGSDRFQEQVKEQTGIWLPASDAYQAVQAYREKHDQVVDSWYALERAAMRAVRYPGQVFACGRNDSIRYVVRRGVLWCILPSGRPLAYSLPRIQMRKTPWGEERPAVTFCGIDGYTRKWERQALYGGWLMENVVQAIARDVLLEAMFRLEEARYPVVMTVHDEVLNDVPEGHGSLEEASHLTTIRPTWATDLPIAVDGWEGGRYRK